MTLFSAALLTAGLAAAPANVRASQTLLLSELQTRFPEVTRWEIKPFTSTTASEKEHEKEDAKPASVVQLGARSAVRTGTRIQWFTVAGFQSVLSAAHPISAGESLSAKDGRVTEKNVLSAPCEPLVDINALNGTRARVQLRANEMICASAIEPRPVVARGEEVTVRYVSDRVILTTRGIAHTDGALGDSLLVRNPRSRDSFQAQVSGEKEVTIRE